MTDLYFTRSLRTVGEQRFSYEDNTLSLADSAYGPRLSVEVVDVPNLGIVPCLKVEGLQPSKDYGFAGTALSFGTDVAFATPPFLWRSPDRTFYYVLYFGVNTIPAIPAAGWLVTYEVLP